MAVALANNGFFLWDLDGNVGPRQPNRADDVELVRFGYFMLSQAPEANGIFKPMKPLLDKMSTSGGFDQNLADVIKAHQSLRGGTQDGHVSKTRVTILNHGLYDRKHAWIMVALNNIMHDFNQYPRLDLHPKCGPNLRATVKRIFRQG